MRRQRRPGAPAIPVGIDTGGTFTDIVALVDGRIRVHKVLSTPDNPARAVIDGLTAMLAGAAPGVVTYSSTVATNALLEKNGARVALFTNAGFEDLIEIGRQNRTELYALAPTRPEPLVARAMRFGVGAAHLVRRHRGDCPERGGADPASDVSPRDAAPTRSRSACCTATRTRAAEARVGARARSASASALGLASNSARVPRIRTALDHRRQCLRQSPDGHASGDSGARTRAGRICA